MACRACKTEWTGLNSNLSSGESVLFVRRIVLPTIDFRNRRNDISVPF